MSKDILDMVKATGGNIFAWRRLSDKIQDEQWSTLKIKKLWKKDPLFAKWFKRNVLNDYSKESGHRYYPSKFRGEYGPKD
jgi:hypothetical protein